MELSPADLRAVDRVATETAFSGVVRVDRGADVELLAAYGDADRRWGIANTPDTRFATASGTKGSDRPGGRHADRGRHARPGDDGQVAARRRPPAHRRRGDRRAVARPSLGDRRLPRRGRRHGPQRLPDAGAGPATGGHRGLRGGARRVSDEVPARRAVLLLQRRLHGARPDRRASVWRAVPRSRRPTRVRAGGDDRHRVPALRRAARANRRRLPRRRRTLAQQRVPPPGARQR